jgi:hypothetical protein
MGVIERAEFFAWYEEQKSMAVVFNIRQTLESCRDDVTVLQACQVFKNEFTRVGNFVVFQESVTIASACNKVLRRRF